MRIRIRDPESFFDPGYGIREKLLCNNVSFMLDEEAQQGPPDQVEPEEQEEEMDPYTRALRESMMKLPKEEQGIGM